MIGSAVSLAISFGIGLGMGLVGLMPPAPPILTPALCVVAMTVGYLIAERLR